jgi:hypothetical protein
MTNLTPGEELLTLLDQLRKRLSNSGVERTQGLRDTMGKDCPYYKKSMQIFLERDYVDIKNLIQKIDSIYQLVGDK